MGGVLVALDSLTGWLDAAAATAALSRGLRRHPSRFRITHTLKRCGPPAVINASMNRPVRGRSGGTAPRSDHGSSFAAATMSSLEIGLRFCGMVEGCKIGKVEG